MTIKVYKARYNYVVAINGAITKRTTCEIVIRKYHTKNGVALVCQHIINSCYKL